MKTAVEYIEEKTDIEWIAREEWWDIIELAKGMEKEQLKRAYERGKKYKKPIKDSNPIQKTFKQEEQ